MLQLSFPFWRILKLHWRWLDFVCQNFVLGPSYMIWCFSCDNSCNCFHVCSPQDLKSSLTLVTFNYLSLIRFCIGNHWYNGDSIASFTRINVVSIDVFIRYASISLLKIVLCCSWSKQVLKSAKRLFIVNGSQISKEAVNGRKLSHIKWACSVLCHYLPIMSCLRPSRHVKWSWGECWYSVKCAL